MLEHAETVVEYGAGGTTLLAVKSSAKRIISIEADPKWLSRLRRNWRIGLAEIQGRLDLRYVNIGPVAKQWSMPADESGRHLWPAYALAPWRPATSADLVLVDGRFRVACIAQTVLNSPSATIVVHDFWNRPRCWRGSNFRLLTAGVPSSAERACRTSKESDIGRIGKEMFFRDELLPSQKRHLFVCGCPRSGTTALQLLLVSHPRIVLGAERYSILARKGKGLHPDLFTKNRFFDIRPRDTFYDAAKYRSYYDALKPRFDDAAWVGDKAPWLFYSLDYINREFPSAHIIVIVRRNPQDVASSYQVRAREPRTKPGRPRVTISKRSTSGTQRRNALSHLSTSLRGVPRSR